MAELARCQSGEASTKETRKTALANRMRRCREWWGHPASGAQMLVRQKFMKLTCIILAILCLAVERVRAWGEDGHSIVAEIAQRRLTPEAAAVVDRLLGHGYSLASIASWADDYRDQDPATGPWHFVDIPVDSTQFDPASQCVNDGCVIA